MGKTLVIYRIKPGEIGGADDIIAELKNVKNGKFQDAKKEPIGFGVELVKAGFTVPEKDDAAIEALTKELGKVRGAEEAELVEMTLL
ncbi:MAG: hypothetical protein V1676_01435 [Candidatus Diapherotrites archaeon]